MLPTFSSLKSSRVFQRQVWKLFELPGSLVFSGFDDNSSQLSPLSPSPSSSASPKSIPNSPCLRTPSQTLPLHSSKLDGTSLAFDEPSRRHSSLRRTPNPSPNSPTLAIFSVSHARREKLFCFVRAAPALHSTPLLAEHPYFLSSHSTTPPLCICRTRTRASLLSNAAACCDTHATRETHRLLLSLTLYLPTVSTPNRSSSRKPLARRLFVESSRTRAFPSRNFTVL